MHFFATTEGPLACLALYAVILNLWNLAVSFWPPLKNKGACPVNWLVPVCFTWVALLFAKHSGLTIVEQYYVFSALLVACFSLLPQSK